MDTLGELSLYPEIKKFLLTNKFTTDEKLVTMQQLKNAFSDEEINLMLCNRSKHWILIEL